MQKLIFLLVLIGIGIFGYSQSWTAGSGILYTNPTTTRISIGINFASNLGGDLHFRSLKSTLNMNLYNHLMILTYDGCLGINTLDPGNYKLAVNGDVRAKSVRVETNWSDFVFDADYKLLSLSEVERFISLNKHLPEIPSAKEVEENGVSLGDMQAKLLQKIEELTLYAIEQQKCIEELQKRLSELEDKKGGE